MNLSKVSRDSSLSDFSRSQRLAKLWVERKDLMIKKALRDEKCKHALAKELSSYNEVYDSYYEFNTIKGEHSIEADSAVSVINPKKLEENCQRCAIAYELRRRGYDVTSSDGDGDYLADKMLIKSCFANSNSSVYKNKPFSDCLKSINDKMLSYQDGARSIILINSENGGHIINAEVVNGKVFGIDSQNGIVSPIEEIYKDKEGNRQAFDWATEIELIRVDDVEETAATREYVKEVKNNG